MIIFSCLDRKPRSYFFLSLNISPIYIQSVSRPISRRGPKICPLLFPHCNASHHLLCSVCNGLLLLHSEPEWSFKVEIRSSPSQNPTATSHHSWNKIQIPCSARPCMGWYLTSSAVLSPIIFLSVTDHLTFLKHPKLVPTLGLFP